MSNDIIEIKRQVAETSAPKKSYRPYNKNSSSPSQPPNVISNAESDQDTEGPSPSEHEPECEEEVELNGLWDFILPTEEERKAMPVSTRSKSSSDSTISNQKQKYLPTKEKATERSYFT